ncbi:MAG: hypothetical protein HQK89_06105 [Nitrospirae bacterium]|nr:hypothetical protein [Nitrospirota bacterium]
MNAKVEIKQKAETAKEGAMKDRLLFVTGSEAGSDNGITYAYELAKNIDAILDILVVDGSVDSKGFVNSKGFGNSKGSGNIEGGLRSEFKDVARGVECKVTFGKDSLKGVVYEVCFGDAVGAISDIIERKYGISMVLLGPGISKGSVFDAKKLSKTISVPIVKISGPIKTGEGGTDKRRKKMGAIKRLIKNIDRYMEAASMAEMRVDIAREKLLNECRQPIDLTSSANEPACEPRREKSGGEYMELHPVQSERGI